MTRDEQIRQKAILEQRGLMESCDWRGGFVSGANWADTTMIDKACEWINMNITDYIVEGSRDGISIENKKQLINDFRSAMEE